MFNDVHTCSIEERLHSRLSSAGIIGGMIRNKYADSESVYSPADIIRDMKKDYGVDLTYMRAWRSKQKALKMLRGNKIESYVKLPSYLYILMHTNPGSIARLQKSEGGSFLYVFVSLDVSIKGWKYCKPIVIVNASLLESAHRGILIMAYTQDAAGRIFLLAYSVVDSENDASWKWFFERFRDAYGAREGMCIVSDMHESISKATSIVYPEVLHCICMFHLWNNIKTRYTKIHTPVKELFFASARAYTIEEFERHMVAINNIDKRVGECLLDVGYHRWSRVHSKVNGTTIMTSNIVESMNTVNNHARDLPILHLLEYMTKLVQDWHYANKINAVETSTELGKKYEEIMKENYTTSQRMTVKPSADHSYTVVDDEKQFVVNLRERTCTCIRFQMDEMPCPHALAVITFKSMDAYQYCSVYYNKDHLLKTYDISTYPVPNESTWDIPREVLEEVVLPPTGKIRPGRPKRLRI
ncbi:protein FAR1-RELATED SEQUENCE 4-like [Solanum tuberosum]|uniref:protein FAR1-RELATED SEQUENCE 4-like n=1 Tax=Solanum tuberosum TaxID=4113 RepID=UPI00073A29C2|nr:PREDICTED: protein FAR1-RELATED SEQUENCE 4-like [Solanum tuberosum]